jgi:hypothetical protein
MKATLEISVRICVKLKATRDYSERKPRLKKKMVNEGVFRN